MALPKVLVPVNALAVLGVILAVIFAACAALPASRWIILALAVLALVVLVFLMGDVIRDRWDLRKENKERKVDRLLRWGPVERVLVEVEINRLSSVYGDGVPNVYGYEVMHSIGGLQDGSAKLKPTQTGPLGERYPLEVHIREGRTYIVGYAADGVCLRAEGDDAVGPVGLFMRRDERQKNLVRIWVERIQDGTSYPDWLDLELGPRVTWP